MSNGIHPDLGFSAAGQSVEERPLDIEHHRDALLQQQLLSISGHTLLHQQHVWLVVCHTLYSDPQVLMLLHTQHSILTWSGIQPGSVYVECQRSLLASGSIHRMAATKLQSQSSPSVTYIAGLGTTLAFITVLPFVLTYAQASLASLCPGMSGCYLPSPC